MNELNIYDIISLPREIQIYILKYIYIDYKLYKIEIEWEYNELIELFHLYINVIDKKKIFIYFCNLYKIEELLAIALDMKIFDSNELSSQYRLKELLDYMRCIDIYKIPCYKLYNEYIAIALDNRNEEWEQLYLLEDDFH